MFCLYFQSSAYITAWYDYFDSNRFRVRRSKKIFTIKFCMKWLQGLTFCSAVHFVQRIACVEYHSSFCWSLNVCDYFYRKCSVHATKFPHRIFFCWLAEWLVLKNVKGHKRLSNWLNLQCVLHARLYCTMYYTVNR